MPPHSSASSAALAMFYSTKYEAPQQDPWAIVSRGGPLSDGSACPRRHSKGKQGVGPPLYIHT